MENLRLADQKASKDKGDQYGVQLFNKNKEANLLKLHLMLKNKTYTTSAYKTFTLYDPKKREISSLPYFPDRIVHHAAMIPLEPVFVSTFTADTYSCIKRKGIHPAVRYVKKALQDVPGTQYCLKLDIKKFYPSIDHKILKQLLRRKIKDKDQLWLLDNIIDSAPGVPICNYLSQYFANFYLAYFDHWIKENKGVKYYLRYADDMIFLSGSKEYLHKLLADIREYLLLELNLSLKDNYQIFPVDARGIDILGYVFRHKYVRLRKRLKKNFARAVARNDYAAITSYYGWAIPCNSKHLLKKLSHGNEKFQRLWNRAA